MRADLRSLTPESLAALANLGLVKRAQRELEQGKVPSISEDGKGVVSGEFPDGVTVRLLPGKPLTEGPCSCGATAVCRHRIALALFYKTWVESQAEPQTAVATIWSPSGIDDGALSERLGKKTLDRARALVSEGVTAEVLRCREGTVPAVQLPSCSVRFLVPWDLAYAQCDCTLRQDCEHIALAVWAFRAADAKAPEEPKVIVELGERQKEDLGSPLDKAAQLAGLVLLEGVVSMGEGLSQKFALCRDALEREGFTWPAIALEDMEDQLRAYRSRSSRYQASSVLELAAELHARPAAARSHGALPARHILGQGEALETRLDHIRLVSLGARIEPEERAMRAEVFLLDPDTATVLVFEKTWSFAPDEKLPKGPELAPRRITTGATLGALARGVVVSKVARRRANRALVFGEGRGGMTSVTPQAGDWDHFPFPVFIERLADLRNTWKSRPPRLLRPRVKAEDLHVLAVSEVLDVGFSAATQELVAFVNDQAGETCRVTKPFRASSPRALEHLAGVLGGTQGDIRFLSGFFSRRGGGFEVSPIAAVGNRVVVLDLEDEPPAVPLPDLLEDMGAESSLERAVLAALGVLTEGVHTGMKRAREGYPDRIQDAARTLARHGLTTTSGMLLTAEAAIRDARRGGSWEDAAHSFARAAIRCALAGEVL